VVAETFYFEPLFALVGIAGEDDLDAPDFDLNPAAEQPSQGKQWSGPVAVAARIAPGDGKLPRASARSVLGAQLSASLRESLIEQLASISKDAGEVSLST
jgi:hypothetical protein